MVRNEDRNKEQCLAAKGSTGPANPSPVNAWNPAARVVFRSDRVEENAANILSAKPGVMTEARRKAALRKIWIGTSGWTYDDWRGPFYPRDVARKRWLRWYATQFTTTEINGSFYRTPSLETVRRWRDDTPDGFQFSWKASKYITHWKRLGKSSKSSLKLMNTRLRALGSKLGPVLFQLPTHVEADTDRLEAFLSMLSERHKHVFEFRHESWYAAKVLALLREHNAALCISDHHQAPAPWEVTAQHVYIRGHGPSGRYKDHYSDKALEDWSERIKRWRSGGREVFVYFDNDQKSAAPEDARRLLSLLGA